MQKAPIKLLPPTNQHTSFYRPDALLVAQPTVLELRVSLSLSLSVTVLLLNGHFPGEPG